MKHTERNISDTVGSQFFNSGSETVFACLTDCLLILSFVQGLDILHELLQNVGSTPNVAQSFYQQYLLSLIQDVFAVMTDRLHKSGFKMHATLLKLMFHIVQGNQVTVPLFDPSTQPHGQTNQRFLQEHISTLLITSFPNLSKPQVTKFVERMFDIKMDLPAFKTHLRDFLIELKEFSAEDNSALFSEEFERERNQREQAILAERSAVPGMLKPSEIDSDL